MTTTIVNLDVYRENKEAQKPVVFSLEEALDYIRNEGSTSVVKLAYLYESTAVHVREDLLGKVANIPDSEIAPYRKSMFFQVAHYTNHTYTQDEPSIEMLLAIHYGLLGKDRTLQIDRLAETFIQNRLPSESSLGEILVPGLSSYPYKFGDVLITPIVTQLRARFIAKRKSK